VLEVELVPWTIKPEVQGFEWKIIGFTTSGLSLQIDFSDPLEISSGPNSEHDKLTVTVKQPKYFKYFVENKSLKEIPADTSVKATIPSQFTDLESA